MLVAVFAFGFAPRAVAAAPWRSVSAPARTFALADYVMQSPGNAPGPGTGGEEDTTDTEPPLPEPAVPPPSQQPPPVLRQPGSVRPDSARAFPGAEPAAAETIGPRSGIPIPQAVTSASAPPVHTRHGFMGLAPIALLAGLIVLHVFVVTAVAK